jgi:hypothetical protein
MAKRCMRFILEKGEKRMWLKKAATIAFGPIMLFCGWEGCTSPPERTIQTMDSGKVVCGQPPKELGNPAVRAEADVVVPKLGQLLKANAGAEMTEQRVRQELHPQVANWEVIDYRLCLMYANNVLTADDYRRYTAQVLPVLKEVSPSVNQKTTGRNSPAIANTGGDVSIGSANRADESSRAAVPGNSGPPMPEPESPIINQETQGENSPAIGNTRGNVRIRP